MFHCLVSLINNLHYHRSRNCKKTFRGISLLGGDTAGQAMIAATECVADGAIDTRVVNPRRDVSCSSNSSSGGARVLNHGHIVVALGFGRRRANLACDGSRSWPCVATVPYRSSLWQCDVSPTCIVPSVEAMRRRRADGCTGR